MQLGYRTWVSAVTPPTPCSLSSHASEGPAHHTARRRDDPEPWGHSGPHARAAGLRASVGMGRAPAPEPQFCHLRNGDEDPRCGGQAAPSACATGAAAGRAIGFKDRPASPYLRPAPAGVLGTPPASSYGSGVSQLWKAAHRGCDIRAVAVTEKQSTAAAPARGARVRAHRTPRGDAGFPERQRCRQRAQRRPGAPLAVPVTARPHACPRPPHRH